MFLTGPAVVREVIGEDVSAARARRHRGCTSATASATSWPTTDAEAALLARELLAYLPQRSRRRARGARRRAAAPARDPGAIVPAEARAVYDVRDVARRVLDDGGTCSRSRPRWARNIVTGFGAARRAPVGVVANQPRHLGGVLDAASSQKGARFVRHVRRVRHPAGGARGHARVHARHAPGGRRA